MSRNRIALWFENMSRPGLFLAAVVVLLYARTLPWGFVLDDYRHIQILEDYHSGDRSWTPLYQFLVSPEGNHQARMTGEHPWWLGSDVRYGHWRPVAERLLYFQFTQFGRNPLGYRIVNLVLYALGAVLMYRVFQRIGGDERLARWGALCFALFTAHTIPVIFISAQGDPLSLVLVAFALLGAIEFVERGRVMPAILATLCFLLALGSKESCLAVAAAPTLIAFLGIREAGPDRRERRLRAAAMTGAWTLFGAIWLYYYMQGGFGSNAEIMLNPAQDPTGYLMALPFRAITLLTALVIPVNPFLFYLWEHGFACLVAFCAIGTILIFMLARMTYKRHRSRDGVAAMAAWILIFVPLLVCTVPDDRVMMLPSIGFAFLAGAWITREKGGQSVRPARWAILLFVFFHPFCVQVACQIMRLVEVKGEESLRVAAAGFGREMKPRDCALFLNSTFESNLLFVQPRFQAVTGRRDALAAFLTDLADPVVTRTDAITLRIQAPAGRHFFGGFLGSMSATRAKPKQVGETFSTREFDAKITHMEATRVTEVELRFREPLESDRYRFYKCGALGIPTRWLPPPVH